MNVETFKQEVKNVFITSEQERVSIDATQWANMDGLNILITGKDLAIRGSLALTWEECELLILAISALRAPE